MSASYDLEQMQRLMAYADGELEGAERLEVEKLLESDPEAARIVAQMGSLGDFVRLGHEDAVAPKLAKVDLTDAIMEAVAKEKIEGTPAVAAGVTSLAAARARRRTIGTGVVAALALAASVFVMTRQKTEAPIAKAPVVETPASNGMNALASAGVEVEAVESPGHSVSVFYLPSANELSTSVVVWVDETSEK
jgi:anti-sigma factor RsiW